MNFGKHDRMIKYLFFLILILSSPLHSHEIKPAVMDITIIEGNASIEFKLNAETVLSEIDVSLYQDTNCLLYTSPSPRDPKISRMPSSA